MVKYNVDMFLRDVVNFLDAKKLERGQTFYDHAKITHLSEIVDIKSTLFRESAYKKQDSFAVDRILNNLLDNAVKYTDKGGSINVSLTMVKKKVLLEISDTGIGIPQNQLDKIFEPYYQISHEKRNIQGIGMGLFIIKNIIDEIRGSIEVASELNKGTTFRIFLKRHTVTKKELQDKDNQYSTPLERDHFSFKKREDTIRAGKYNILLVDDNIEILNLLESSLEHLYNVFPFTNGKEALESLGKIPIPDLIISDIMMDVMDGHEFFKNISASKEYSHIPFIFLTAKNSLKEKIKSLRKGAVDYIYKPFLIEEIIAKIESIVMQKKKYDEQKFKDRFEKACSDNELTCREKDVLELLAKGLMYKEISSILNISMKTVEYHIHNIYTKFSVQSIAELMRTLM
jgi:DNA-binding NarL/FixJ family response regulator/anti-sigma regulatory factor (Ser/Thr protein kinase)